MSKHPRDEFDRVPENSSRRGVHRNSIDAPKAALAPLIVFGVVALIIGAAAFFVLPNFGFGAPSDNSASSSAAPTTAPASSSAPGTPSSSAAAAPSPRAAAAPSPSAPSAPPAAAIDKTTPISVLNASGVVGLAAKYGGMVSGAGWPVSQMGNWAGAAQPSSVILYQGAEQKANAEALGALLGITRVTETAQLPIPLAVVLGTGAL